jgi:uncharacterized protein (DUF2147 family)
MIRLVILFCSFFLVFSSFSLNISGQSNQLSPQSYSADDIIGTWTNSDNIMRVKIEKIGSHYFGKLVWLEKPKEPDGTPKLDKHNPDPNLRTVPFIGLRVMKDMKYRGDGVYSGGTLYDPEKGKTYGCKIAMVSKDIASIRGFVGVALLGKSEKFSRVSK